MGHTAVDDHILSMPESALGVKRHFPYGIGIIRVFSSNAVFHGKRVLGQAFCADWWPLRFLCAIKERPNCRLRIQQTLYVFVKQTKKLVKHKEFEAYISGSLVI